MTDTRSAVVAVDNESFLVKSSTCEEVSGKIAAFDLESETMADEHIDGGEAQRVAVTFFEYINEITVERVEIISLGPLQSLCLEQERCERKGVNAGRSFAKLAGKPVERRRKV